MSEIKISIHLIDVYSNRNWKITCKVSSQYLTLIIKKEKNLFILKQILTSIKTLQITFPCIKLIPSC